MAYSMFLDQNQLFNLFFILCFVQLTSCSQAQLCPQDQSFALLQFKKQFSFDKSASRYCDYVGVPSYPKLKSWNESSGDCCSWDGVECDRLTGNAIALDLSCSQLNGAIHPNSSLFLLPHIRRLNLASNFFDASPISSSFAQFTELTHLNLSDSSFSGKISPEIFVLSNLASLDLSWNYDARFQNPSFELHFQNLTKLRELDVSGVNKPSVAVIPNSLLNLTSLTHLRLSECELQGKFPEEIFHLPNLRVLHLDDNSALTGPLPKQFNSSSPLQDLKLRDTNFSGEVPHSIGNLKSLKILNLDFCKFSGPIPASLGNLTQLEYLSLSYNKFTGLSSNNLSGNGIVELSMFSKLKNLRFLDLSSNNLSLNTNINVNSTLPQFTSLSLSDLNLREFPNFLRTQENLEYLDLSGNDIHGEIPPLVCNFNSLVTLYLSRNNLTGTLPCLGNFSKSLSELSLWGNNFSGAILKSLVNCTTLQYLNLGNNRISDTFPYWLDNLPLLQVLKLRSNQFHGPITISTTKFPFPNLHVLDISHNAFIGPLPAEYFKKFEAMMNVDEFNFQNYYDTYIDLSENKFEGEIPESIGRLHSMYNLNLSHNNLRGHIPTSLGDLLMLNSLDLSHNNIHGEIPSSLCHLSSLQILRLFGNNLIGELPHCLGNFSTYMYVLDLHKNNFSGTIPNTFTDGNGLGSINLNGNRLEGPIPKSLVNCSWLEVLDLGNNRIRDSFPSWLDKLRRLHVLVLRSNQFHGPVTASMTKFPFPNLRVFDISNNSFTGPLPAEYFKKFEAMMNIDESKYELTYMAGYYSFTITLKGSIFEMDKVLTIFTAIDLSRNKFAGEIPKVVGNLNSVKGLNLSHNNLRGQIPTSLQDLRVLESLDLSSNQLVGDIPQQLTTLTSLGVLNLSYNQLTGRIPQGNQFGAFTENSYYGNPGLCGLPLSSICGNSEAPVQEDTSESPSDFDWNAAIMGYGYGLVCGFAFGYLILWSRNPKWFARILEIVQQSARRSNKRAYRHSGKRT